MPQAPLTELDAVNHMLSTIGEAPVNTLSGSQTLDVSEAQRVLGQVANEVQTKGYNFNREYNVTLNPNGSGEIVIPSNYIRVKIDYDNQGGTWDLVQRGQKMYNRKDRTYVFTQALKFEVIVLLPFEEMPEAARRFILIKACRVFADRRLGDQATHAYSAQDEMRAYSLLANEEASNEGHTIFDNMTVARPLFRTSHALPI